MKCEKCGKNEATMYYKETINGVTREMHLCPECAQKENLGGAFENAFESMNHFWSDPFHSFLGGGFGSLWNDMLGAPSATMLGPSASAPTCGMTESELRRTGPRRLSGLLQHLLGHLKPPMCRRSTARHATSVPPRLLLNSPRLIRLRN